MICCFRKGQVYNLVSSLFFSQILFARKKKLFHYFLFLIFASLNFFFTANIMKKRVFLYQISVTFVVNIWPGNKFFLIFLFLWALKTIVIKWSTITSKFAENLINFFAYFTEIKKKVIFKIKYHSMYNKMDHLLFLHSDHIIRSLEQNG